MAAIMKVVYVLVLLLAIFAAIQPSQALSTGGANVLSREFKQV
jgi:hypothetical protein